MGRDLCSLIIAFWKPSWRGLLLKHDWLESGGAPAVDLYAWGAPDYRAEVFACLTREEHEN